MFDEEMRRVLATRAADLMHTKVPTIGSDADISEAATLLVDSKANPIPVVDGGVVIGMLTRADIVRLIVLEEQPDSGTRVR